MTPADLLVISDEMGDLFRVWPNVGVWPIHSWDHLCDWRGVVDMRPSMALVLRVNGDIWTRIRFRECGHCDATGKDITTVEVQDADAHGNVEYGHPDCDWCNGEGWVPEYAEQVTRQAMLGRDAA